MKCAVLNESPFLRYFTFFYLYIMQGIPAGFALTAISNYLLGKNINPEKIGTFIACVGLPWTLQFIWGPLIDRYQYTVMGHRKHWIVFSQWAAVVATTGLIFVKQPEHQLTLLSLIFFTHSIFASIQVASVDAMAISIAPAVERGRLNGYMRGGFLLGSAFGSAVLSIILHKYNFQSAAVVQTFALLAFSIIFFFTKLDKLDLLLPWPVRKRGQVLMTTPNPPFKIVFSRIIKGILEQRSFQYLLIVALLYFCASVFIRSYTFHLINVLQWSDQTVSLFQGGWGSIVTFIAIILAGIGSDKVGAKPMQIKVMWAVCGFLIILNISSRFWCHDSYAGAALILWNLADPLLSVAVFPILMGLCLKKVEGSQFTTYLALINLCDVIGSYITGWCLTFISAPMLGLACGLLMLTMLLFIKQRGNYSIIPDAV